MKLSECSCCHKKRKVETHRPLHNTTMMKIIGLCVVKIARKKMMHIGKRCGKIIINRKGLGHMSLSKEDVLQQWVNDFVDMCNREPTKETLDLWKYQIWELHFNDGESNGK